MQADRIAPQGGIVFRGDSVYYYASTPRNPYLHRLEQLRYDEDGPIGVTVLADDVWTAELQQLSASATRLYAIEVDDFFGGDIWSVSLWDGAVRHEGIFASSMAVLGPVLAWVSYDGSSGLAQLFVRRGEENLSSLPYHLVGAFLHATVIATEQSIVVVYITEDMRYGIAHLNVPPSNTDPVTLNEPLASGEGRVTALWTYEDVVYYSLGLTAAEPLYIADSQKIVLDAIDPFAQHVVYEDILLSQFSRTSIDGFRFRVFSEPGYAGDWLTLDVNELPTVQRVPTGDYLWFFDTAQRALVRTPLQPLLRASIER